MKKILFFLVFLLPLALFGQSLKLDAKIFGIELGAPKAETLKILKGKGLKVTSIDEDNCDNHTLALPTKKKITFNGFQWNEINVRFKDGKTISISFDVDCASPTATRTKFLSIVKDLTGKYKLNYTDKFGEDMYYAKDNGVVAIISYSEHWQTASLDYELEKEVPF